MKKSDLIESWLNSEISEDEAILILERMKHDDSFTKELVNSGEIHAALYTIFHEDTSFDDLKLLQQSKSPDEIEDQIMGLIAAGEPKSKEKKKRITVIDLPQNVTVKTKSFEETKNYWPLFASVAALLVLVFSIALFSKSEDVESTTVENNSLAKDEQVSLVKDKKKTKEVQVKKKNVVKNRETKNHQAQPLKEVPLKKVVAEVEKKQAPQDSPPKESPNLKPDNVLEAMGHFTEASDYGTVSRKGEVLDVAEGMKVLPGDVLSTSFESGTAIKLSDGSTIFVDPSTELVLSPQKITVVKGHARFKVAKQKSGVFQVISGKTSTTVVGTEFTVRYKNHLSMVQVQSGIVKVKSQQHEVTLQKDQGAISKDGSQVKKIEISEQFGLLAAKWTEAQIGPQVGVLQYDISDSINSNGYQDFYFKKSDDESKGMLQVFKVELYENDKLIAVDEHAGVTSNHTTDLRNRDVWLYGGYGSSMYRMYLRDYSIKNKYTLKVRCRSFKGSCDGEIWLLSTETRSPTLKPNVLPTGKNLAYKKKVTTENKGVTAKHGPEMIVDNKINPRSSWWGAGSKWVQIDLGKETEFNSMHIVNFWEQNCYHQYFVEVSKDGENWERVVDMTESTLPAHETGQFHRFDSVKAQYIRMTVNRVRFSQGGISVVELKVFKFHK